MKKFYPLLWLSWILLSINPISSNAQESHKISINLTGASFENFVTAIEAQTPITFYYDRQWTDSLTITLTAANQPLTTVLDNIFSTTSLHYAVHEKSIFITSERQILAELPIDYFHQGIQKPLTDDIDYTEFARQQRHAKLAEEKLYIIGSKSSNLQGTATLAGTIRDQKTGEPVIGASVYIENPLVGVATDQFGSFALTINKGRHEIKIKSTGMKNAVRQVMLYANGKLEIEIEEEITPLKEILVISERTARVTSMQMGMERLDIKTMRNIPLALGETDILKVMLTLPGVQTVGEGTSGFNVRGGATNQNLILYNDAVVYNPSHVFGFFSTFNPDVLKNVELYKSGIAAEYGGRLSSVLDVRTREGNLKKISGSGGISPITGRISLEGPIAKDKTSFLFGARSTYSGWILRQLNDKGLKNSTASFYDLNANISHKIDDDNSLYFSAYLSKDKFKLNQDTLYSYSDRNASIKWKRSFSSKLFGVFTTSLSRYSYEVSSDVNPVESAKMDFSIQQWNAKADFNYFPDAKRTITAGGGVTRYSLAPGNYQPLGVESEVVPVTIQKEQAIEAALYAGENYELTSRLSVYAGIRYSFYQNFGPREQYVYASGVPREQSSIQDTITYSKGESITTYHGPEPRVSLRYSLENNASVKLSYNRMRQYIQMLSNTTVLAPTDIWKLSDSYIRPQVGNQLSIGYYKNLRSNTIETSVEAYYKTIEDAVDFKDGAELLLNPHIETDILQAQGKAYGLEVFFKKATGKLNGWFSYTYSRSFLRIKGNSSAETINSGRYYPSSYDKPHAVNVVSNYKFNRRINISVNVTYSTGRPITIPIATYDLGGGQRVYYSDRNEFRVPDYFRTDASVNIEGNHKIKKLAHSSWTFAVYNLTGRANPYSVFFVSENGKINGYKLSIFAQPIPTLTYNFKF